MNSPIQFNYFQPQFAARNIHLLINRSIRQFIDIGVIGGYTSFFECNCPFSGWS